MSREQDMKGTYSMIIAEDEAAVAAGLRQLLDQTGHQVLASVWRAEDAVPLALKVKGRPVDETS
jgi:hypothetical protein